MRELLQEHHQAIVEHVNGKTCRSCCAYFSPRLFADLRDGRTSITAEETTEIVRALSDCGSLDDVRESLALG